MSIKRFGRYKHLSKFIIVAIGVLIAIGTVIRYVTLKFPPTTISTPNSSPIARITSFEPYSKPPVCLFSDGIATVQNLTITGTWYSKDNYQISLQGIDDKVDNPIFENSSYCNISQKEQPLSFNDFKETVNNIISSSPQMYINSSQKIQNYWEPHTIQINATQTFGSGSVSCEGDTGTVPKCFFYSLSKVTDFWTAISMCRSLTTWSGKSGCYDRLVEQFAVSEPQLSLELCDARYPNDSKYQSDKSSCYTVVGKRLATIDINKSLDICTQIMRFDHGRQGCSDFIGLYQKKDNISEQKLVLRCQNYLEGDIVTKYLCLYSLNSNEEKFHANSWCAHRHLLWMYGNEYRSKSIAYCNKLSRINPSAYTINSCKARIEATFAEIARGPISSAYQFVTAHPDGLGIDENLSCFSK